MYAAGYTLVVIAILIGLTGCLGSGSATSSAVLDRIREFGIMRAIGAPGSAIRRIVLAEALTGAIAGVTLGTALAAGVAGTLGAMLGGLIDGASLPARFSLPAAAGWAAAVLLLSLATALPPARYAARLTAHDALRRL